MFPKMDPRQMAGLMRQFGIKNEELKASRVVIELQSGKKLIIDSPNVLAIDMQGDRSFQISGATREISSGAADGEAKKMDEAIEKGEEETPETLSENDVAMVAEQAKVGREEARKALEEASGDIAQAILKAKKE